MLLVRRRAPEGSYFADGDRASGVFGVLATGFSVLLGFIVFLAFTTYDESRAGAEAEAVVVAQQVQTAQFFPEPIRSELTGELVCYARDVAGVEWDRLEDGTLGDAVNPWGVAMFADPADVRARGRQRAVGLRPLAGPDLGPAGRPQRPGPRRRRGHPHAPVDRPVLRLGVIFVFMLFFADPAERAVDPGHAHGLGDGGHHDAAAAHRLLRPAVQARASAACSRTPWSGRWSSSTRALGASTSWSSRPVTRTGARPMADARRAEPGTELAGHGAARRRRRGHGLEQLPGDAVER